MTSFARTRKAVKASVSTCQGRFHSGAFASMVHRDLLAEYFKGKIHTGRHSDLSTVEVDQARLGAALTSGIRLVRD